MTAAGTWRTDAGYREEEPRRFAMKSLDMGVGIAIGVAVGAAIGISMDNLGIGMAIGIALGAALGGAWSSYSNRDR